MVTSLINFPDRQKLSALREMSDGKVKTKDFYKGMFHFWSWNKTLERRLARMKDSDSKVGGSHEMSGVRSAVCGQEMALKPNSPYITAETCQMRALRGGYIP